MLAMALSPRRRERREAHILPTVGLLAAIVVSWAAAAQQPAPPADESARTLELAKKAQNPIANLISLPLQNDLNFGYGAKDAPHSSSTQYVLNIQPVVPVEITDELNLITRPTAATPGAWATSSSRPSCRPRSGTSRSLASAPCSSSRAPPTARSSGRRNGAPGRARSRWSCRANGWSAA
jgi:hypothetical protein